MIRTTKQASAKKISKKKSRLSYSCKPLNSKEVFADCPTDLFTFKTTKTIKSSNEIIAQHRAVRAIDMGLGIRKPGYNIYVAGYTGTGKTSVIETFLTQWSKNSLTPPDWVYVYNFDRKDTPKALPLKAGEGAVFKKMMEQALDQLQREIPAALQSEEYENTINAFLSQNNEKQARRFSELEKLARKMQFAIKSTSMGIETIPIVDGRTLTEKEYAKLGDKDRDEIENRRGSLEPQVLDFARKVRKLEVDAKEYVTILQKQLVQNVINSSIEKLLKRFSANDDIKEHLSRVRDHILENLVDFATNEESNNESDGAGTTEVKEKHRKYHVNLFVDNSKQVGAPVIIESNPTYYNLFGKAEKNVEHGMFLTDFTMIQSGAIHQANGGYLVLEASDIFKMPLIWDTLKRVLRNRKGFIEDMGEQYSMLPTTAIRPEPIPLDLKVILIGSDDIYHGVYEVDEEFSKIFKIKADFDYKIPRNKANIKSYVSFIATRARKESLLPFDRSGVSAVIEYGSRLVEDQTQLTAQFSNIKDLTIEADYVAREEKSSIVHRMHVEKALERKFYRVSLFEHHLLEMIKANELMISVDGKMIGQVNGLAVYDMGDYSFGKLGRITCARATSEDGIFNVERESKLSGTIHDKATYILSGFLNSILTKNYTLGFSASICFEQSYGVIDGDSATAAELTAVISAFSEIPIKQNVAITGSCNQLGDIQPVGGINEKIEGFVNIANLIGKGKEYILILPAQNKTNLMLNKAARDAIKSGRLKIYPVTHIWEVFEIATDHPFGAKSIYDRTFEPGSALAVIEQKLLELQTREHHGHAQNKTAAQTPEPVTVLAKPRKAKGSSRRGSSTKPKNQRKPKSPRPSQRRH